MPMRVIFNPVAGGGRARSVFERLKPLFDEVHADVVATRYPGHARELAREVASEADWTVVSLGGDGTHHEVVNGLMPQAKATLAVIAAGTGNDFARALGHATDPVRQWAVAREGAIRRIDVGTVNGRYFLTVAGVGFDAQVAEWANHHKRGAGSGAGLFVRGVLANLWSYRSAELTVTLPEGVEEAPTFLLACANTGVYAGGMRICPSASPDDGRLSVVWIGPLAPWQVLPLLVRVFSGSHVSHRAVRILEAPRLAVDGPRRLAVHADGELIGHLPIAVGLHPQALAVRVGPPGGAREA
ncbi:MAG: diacylglycerol kinase family lipid kinase [Firmicutes bacterium]|nr:diacylglycerol kinase family lipid kinase [Alicyclobacillaceae bacterium]MCL6498082.1 diacylglycerol kinase family lipid kinase [Bacillota bacterium]